MSMQTVDVALAELIAERRPQYRHLAQRYVGNIDEAEDVLQNALISAWVNRHSFEGRSQLSTWLSRIVINAALMYLRRPRYEFTSFEEPVLGAPSMTLEDVIPDPKPDAATLLAKQQRDAILHEMVQSVPQRRELELRYVDGLSIKEIQTVTGKPIGTVKATLSRGHAQLKKRYAQMMAITPNTSRRTPWPQAPLRPM